MSPEQAKAKKLDGRSDLYSLGIVLYECLMGRAPFHANDPVSLLIQHVHDPPPTFAEKAPDLVIDAEIEAITRKALEKERDDRFPTADAFKEVLDDYLALARSSVTQGSAQLHAPVAPAELPGPTVVSPGLPQSPPPTPAPAPVPAPQHTPTPVPPQLPAGHPAQTWSGDAGQLDMSEEGGATTFVKVKGEGQGSGGLLAAVFILGLLLFLGVGYLIFEWNQSPNGAGDPDVGPDITDADIETTPPDAVEVRDADVEDRGQPPPGIEDGGGETTEEAGAPEGDTVVDATGTRLVAVRFNLTPDDLELDFGDRSFEREGGAYVFDLADGNEVSYSASADDYRTRRGDVNLTDADENNAMSVRVRLRRREQVDPCILPSGLRDPFCP
jgi:hypothetical protein